jgi:hypothetical protein
MFEMRMLPSMTRDQSVLSYLTGTLGIKSTFMLPFYLIDASRLSLCPTRAIEVKLAIKKVWSTSWGGGRIINAFFGENLSAFAQRDTSDCKQRVKLPFQGGRSNAILGAILVNSPFGRTIASAGDFATPAIRLQVGLYLLCELRKVRTCAQTIRITEEGLDCTTFQASTGAFPPRQATLSARVRLTKRKEQSHSFLLPKSGRT